MKGITKNRINALKRFIGKHYEQVKQSHKEVISLLQDVGATKENPIEFPDWEECNAPSHISTYFDDDLADTYITAIWVENEEVMGNLHAFYIEEDLENVSIFQEPTTNWFDILDWLLVKLGGAELPEKEEETPAYYCPECGELLEQGDYYYDYISGNLYVEHCPNCGCEGERVKSEDDNE